MSPKVFDSDGQPLPHIRARFDEIGSALKIKKLEDWYAISVEAFDEHDGGPLLRRHFNGSMSGALQKVYPEHEWNLFNFKNKQKRLYQAPENHRAYFDWLGQELGVRVLEDWYSLLPTTAKIRQLGGAALVKQYSGSPILALQAAYPEHVFHIWKFSRVPVKTWKNPKLLRQFFDSLAPQVGVKKLDDWYEVADRRIVGDAGGWTAVFENKGLASVFNKAYPEHQFVEWKFLAVPTGFWNQQSNRRRVLLWIAREKGLIAGKYDEAVEKIEESDLEQLYQIQYADLAAFGGTFCVNFYIYSQGYRFLIDLFVGVQWRDCSSMLTWLHFWPTPSPNTIGIA
jgi:hypothetical protein